MASVADLMAPETAASVDLKLLEWGLALISPGGRDHADLHKFRYENLEKVFTESAHWVDSVIES